MLAKFKWRVWHWTYPVVVLFDIALIFGMWKLTGSVLAAVVVGLLGDVVVQGYVDEVRGKPPENPGSSEV